MWRGQYGILSVAIYLFLKKTERKSAYLSKCYIKITMLLKTFDDYEYFILSTVIFKKKIK